MLSLVVWVCNTMVGWQRKAFVMRYLHIAAISASQHRPRPGDDVRQRRIDHGRFYLAPDHVYAQFVECFLKTDGVCFTHSYSN